MIWIQAIEELVDLGIVENRKSDHPPALLYHKITDQWEAGITWLKPRTFKRQIEVLKSLNWDTVLPGDKAATDRNILLIFDDGYENIYSNAFEIIQQANYKPVVFLPVNYIGKYNTWDHNLTGTRFRHLDLQQIQELVSAGWMVGSHGLDHVDLTLLSDAQIRRELIESRRILEDILGISVKWLSYPFGRYDNRVLEYSLEAGYRGIVSPIDRGYSLQREMKFITADAVYFWDNLVTIHSLLQRDQLYSCQRRLRNRINWFNQGTTLWKKMLR